LVEDFLDTLTNEQRELMEQDILKDTLWKNGTMFDEKDIKDYIFLVLEANDKRRLDELNMRIQNIEEYNEELTKERDELLLRLRHNNKED